MWVYPRVLDTGSPNLADDLGIPYIQYGECFMGKCFWLFQGLLPGRYKNIFYMGVLQKWFVSLISLHANLWKPVTTGYCQGNPSDYYAVLLQDGRERGKNEKKPKGTREDVLWITACFCHNCCDAWSICALYPGELFKLTAFEVFPAVKFVSVKRPNNGNCLEPDY